jgi:peptidoglycan/xylan/chitin deacetylase (PgdA/CDA1 family)
MSKQMLKLGISILIHLGDVVGTWWRRVCGRNHGPSMVVLYYHSVLPQHRALFAAQMDTLLRHATPIDAGAQPDLGAGRRYVAVTFDDAFESLVDNALPELERRAIPCTLFVVVDTLGKAAGWEDIGEETHGHEKIMTPEQLLRLASRLVAIGSHTLTHPLLTSVDDLAAEKELLESREKLERLTGKQIRLFSFPYGACSDRLIELCRKAGYERVFTTLPAPIRNGGFVVGRTPADPTDGALEFRLKLLGAYRWIGLASLLKGKLKRFAEGLRIPGGRPVRARAPDERRAS